VTDPSALNFHEHRDKKTGLVTLTPFQDGMGDPFVEINTKQSSIPQRVHLCNLDGAWWQPHAVRRIAEMLLRACEIAEEANG
jgi:hypothetical protein